MTGAGNDWCGMAVTTWHEMPPYAEWYMTIVTYVCRMMCGQIQQQAAPFWGAAWLRVE
ncbi:MAG: hypothetical protein ACI3ZQ_06290 [Candidatus Cryptobacteroides sp.]